MHQCLIRIPFPDNTMDQNICDNLKLLSLESEPNPEIRIKIGQEEFRCNKQLLESSCDYFKALQSFDSSYHDELVIKGGLDSQSFCIILEFLNDGNLRIDLSNFQTILQSCLFLQCTRAEEESISFISQHLSRENALRKDSLDINSFLFLYFSRCH